MPPVGVTSLEVGREPSFLWNIKRHHVSCRAMEGCSHTHAIYWTWSPRSSVEARSCRNIGDATWFFFSFQFLSGKPGMAIFNREQLSPKREYNWFRVQRASDVSVPSDSRLLSLKCCLTSALCLTPFGSSNEICRLLLPLLRLRLPGLSSKGKRG
jgi:hypothetical protein